MALSVQNIKSSPRAGKIPGGLQIRQCQFTTSTGAGGADYTAGFPLGTIKSALGFRSIFAVLSATVENAAGTDKSDKVWWTYNHLGDNLRFWKGSSGVSNMTEEAGTNIDAGAKIRVTILGV